MSYIRYLCLYAHSGAQRVLCCVFVLVFFVLCKKSLKIPKGGNQNPYIEEEQTTQFMLPYYCPFDIL